MFSYVFKKQRETTPTFEINSNPFKLTYSSGHITLEYLGKSYKDILSHVSLIASEKLFDFTYSFSMFSPIFSIPLNDIDSTPLYVQLQIDFINDQKLPFVGLKNLGATCYINSLLQTIYFMKDFKEKLYKSSGYYCYLLQRLFYSMDCNNSSEISTASVLKDRIYNLIKNFSFVESINNHHDVHEFSKFLFDALEQENKDLIKNTVEGKTVCIVKCKHGCISKTNECFQDLQMIIRDFYENKSIKSLYESFEEFCRPVEIDGFHCSKHGKVKATRRVLFDKLPGSLFILLNRFAMNWELNRYFKINQKYEFPESLDLSKFVNHEQDETPSEPCEKKRQTDSSTNSNYRLFSVIVHSGSVDEGHFYCYLRLGDKFFKFNDESVYECSKEEAIDWNYGGYYPNNTNKEKMFSAYYLVYLRNDHSIFTPNFNVSQTVSSELDLKLRNPLNSIQVKYITSEDVTEYSGAGRFNVCDYNYPITPSKSITCVETDNICKAFPKKTVFDADFKLIKDSAPTSAFYYITPSSFFVFVKIFRELPWCTYPRSLFSLGEKTVKSFEDFKSMSPFENFTIYRDNTEEIEVITAFDQIKTGDSLVIAEEGALFIEFMKRFYEHQIVNVSLDDFIIPLFIKKGFDETVLIKEMQKYFHTQSISILKDQKIDQKNRIKCKITGKIYYVGIKNDSFDINHIDHIHQFVLDENSTVSELIKKFRQSTFICMNALQSEKDLQVIETQKESTNVKILDENTPLNSCTGFMVIQKRIDNPIKVCFYKGMYELINYPFLIEDPQDIRNMRYRYFFTNKIVRFSGKSYVECLPEDKTDNFGSDVLLIEKN